MKKVLVCGDTIIDKYVYGSTTRVSPEAPCLVLDEDNIEEKIGGAGNVENNIHSLCGGKLDISYFGYVDGDGLCGSLMFSKEGSNFIGQFLKRDEILTKTRFVAGDRHLLRVDNKKRYEKELDFSKLNFDDYDLVVVSDYNKGSLRNKFFQKIHSYKEYRGKTPILIETKTNFYKTKDIIYKCNEKERQTALTFYDEEILLQHANALVITKGSKGFEVATNPVFYKKQIYLEHSAVLRQSEIVDVCGAGDTFLAGMAVNYLETGKWDAFEMAKFGNIAAGKSVEHFGTYAVKRSEIERQ